MCNETSRIGAATVLQQFDCDAIFYPHKASLASSSTFGVTSTSASGEKIEDEQNAVLPSDNTPHSDNTTMSQQEDEDPHDAMITFLTGRTKSERSSKERAIIFPVKVSSCCSPGLFVFMTIRKFYRLHECTKY